MLLQVLAAKFSAIDQRLDERRLRHLARLLPAQSRIFCELLPLPRCLQRIWVAPRLRLERVIAPLLLATCSRVRS